jgi:hypothetical protein
LESIAQPAEENPNFFFGDMVGGDSEEENEEEEEAEKMEVECHISPDSNDDTFQSEPQQPSFKVEAGNETLVENVVEASPEVGEIRVDDKPLDAVEAQADECKENVSKERQLEDDIQSSRNRARKKKHFAENNAATADVDSDDDNEVPRFCGSKCELNFITIFFRLIP